MNRATDEIIPPRLVEVAERSAVEGGDALGGGGVLLISARAALLDDGTEDGDGGGLDAAVGVVDAGRCERPGLEVGDPGLVGVDAAEVVEVPEGDLRTRLLVGIFF